MRVDWVWLFLDTPQQHARASWDFWSAATGQRVGDVRGDREQFATLLPGAGDPWVKLQAVGGEGGVHLDLDSADIEATTEHALAAGARLERHYHGVAVMRSPGGFVFCLTQARGRLTQRREEVPLPDQACLDIPPARYAAEVAFWSRLTGWAAEAVVPEFTALARPDDIPVRLLLQRLEDGAPDQPVTAHVDLACGGDRARVAGEHVRLGAEVVREERWWTVMRDPVGRAYCLTGRDPRTGLPGGR